MAGNRNSKAWTYSDRSGMKFPTNEMVVEPGTGFWVHRSESDGQYSQVSHPQANLSKYARFTGDGEAAFNARANEVTELDIFLTDENGDPVENEIGQDLEVDGW